MTKPRPVNGSAAIVYSVWLKEGENEIYMTEIAAEKSFIDEGCWVDLAEMDEVSYYTDPEGNVTIIHKDKKHILVFKPVGAYG